MLGQRSIDAVPTYWAAAPGDLTTALPADSPLRMTPEIFEYLDLSTEEEMAQWGRNIIDASIREQLKRYPIAKRVWHSRGTELTRVSKYLFTRPYIDDYLNGGYVRALAERLNSEVVCCE